MAQSGNYHMAATGLFVNIFEIKSLWAKKASQFTAEVPYSSNLGS